MSQRQRKRPSKSGVSSQPPAAPSRDDARARLIFPGVLLVLFVFVAYLPAMHGTFVWDDDSWTTNLSPFFQNISGVGAIWIHPTALQQYYPLTGTSFWLDYQLWNLWTTPYHVENMLLHAVSAILFWRLLVQLRVPGAWLAGAIFAVHPIMVESVAWITEREMTQYGRPAYITTLAAAYAEAGRFNEATTAAQKARAAASEQGQGDVVAQDDKLLDLFKAGQAYHEPARP